MTNQEPKPLALIVGGSSGIGLATARKILQRGDADVLLVARNEAKLAAAADTLSAFGTVETESVDLRDETAVAALRERLAREERPIKFLVNAAGTFNPTPFLEHTPDDYDKYHDTNKAVFFITQAVARNMRRHGGGAHRIEEQHFGPVDRGAGTRA